MQAVKRVNLKACSHLSNGGDTGHCTVAKLTNFEELP